MWTIIGAADVAGTLAWYQSLLGLPPTPPGHSDFAQVLDADGTVLLCLHEWGAHGHPTLSDPSHGAPDNGLILFLRVSDYPEALGRARDLVARFEEEPHLNAHTGTREFSVRDPEGYFVTISELPEHETGAV